jgi:IclR family acetate operon transcriptional repressor
MSISFMMRNNSVQALDRGLTILDLLANTGGELGVTEVPRQLGVHKSTAYRLLATLQRHDLVDQNPDTEKYRLGHGLVRLAGSVTAAMDLVKASGPGLRDLASATEETVNLAILQGDRVINIDQITPVNQLVNVNWVGKQTPLHCTSNGKVLLAFMPGEERWRLLQRPLQRLTPRTIVDPKLLERQLLRVQDEGYAFTLEELELGLNAVAAPIRGADGHVIAAVSVSGPSYRVTSQRLPELGDLARRTADAVSRRMGYTTGGEQ